jgi:hypothetical protein
MKGFFEGLLLAPRQQVAQILLVYLVEVSGLNRQFSKIHFPEVNFFLADCTYTKAPPQLPFSGLAQIF